MLLDRNLTMYPDQWAALQELADRHANGALSRMLFLLAYQATVHIERFYLVPPADEFREWNVSIPRPQKLVGGQQVRRVNISLSDQEWPVITRLANANTRGNRSHLGRYLIWLATDQPLEFGLVEPDESVSSQMASGLANLAPLDPAVFKTNGATSAKIKT